MKHCHGPGEMFENLHETEETAPNSDVLGCQYSSSSYRVPSRTTDTTSLNNTHASAYENTESDDLVSWINRYPKDSPIPVSNLSSDWEDGEDSSFPPFPWLDTLLEVGSQPFGLSLSSTQPDTMENIPEQVHEKMGELSTNNIGERKESEILLQGEFQGTTPTPSVDVASESRMDYTDQFTTSEKFESKESLSQWARERGKKQGIVIETIRSDNQKSWVILGCERSGKYRDNNKANKKQKQLRNPITKKCECPFKLKGIKLGDNWVLKVVCGMHNHEITKALEVNFYATGRFSKEEKSLVLDMSKSIKEVLEGLKDRDVKNPKIRKQIYNARQKDKAKKKRA